MRKLSTKKVQRYLIPEKRRRGMKIIYNRMLHIPEMIEIFLSYVSDERYTFSSFCHSEEWPHNMQEKRFHSLPAWEAYIVTVFVNDDNSHDVPAWLSLANADSQRVIRHHRLYNQKVAVSIVVIGNLQLINAGLFSIVVLEKLELRARGWRNWCEEIDF